MRTRGDAGDRGVGRAAGERMRRATPAALGRPRIPGTRARGGDARAALLAALLAISLLSCDAPAPARDATAPPNPPATATVAPTATAAATAAPTPVTPASAASPASPGPTGTAATASTPAATALPPVPTTPAATPTSTPPESPPPIQLEVVVTPIASGIPAYDRDEWSHWRDADGDCQDTRQEVLIDESRLRVSYESGPNCRVGSGLWVGPYTGLDFTHPGDLDIDHMVPLHNAHRSGGWAWSRERKAAYANDLSYDNHLIAAQSSANRRKGASGPEQWKPPLRSYWCHYAIDWIVIKQTWDLTSTESELAALRSMLEECTDPPALTVRREDAAAPGRTGESTATPAPPSVLLYDPAGPDRDCGDFPSWAEAQAFYTAAGGPGSDRHRLDGDGDGIVCESLPGAP